jgi:hypothetical protein
MKYSTLVIFGIDEFVVNCGLLRGGRLLRLIAVNAIQRAQFQGKAVKKNG